MLTITVDEEESVKITHGGEELYIGFEKKRSPKGGMRYRLNIIGPQTFQIKREKLKING